MSLPEVLRWHYPLSQLFLVSLVVISNVVVIVVTVTILAAHCCILTNLFTLDPV